MTQDEISAALREIRRRVEDAVAQTGVGLKPFAVRNGMGETVVRDLLKAHNKDIQIVTLLKIAKGCGCDVTSFFPGQPRPLTQPLLKRVLTEALQGPRPAAESLPEYLSEVLLQQLQLPEGLIDAPANDVGADNDGSAAADQPR